MRTLMLFCVRRIPEPAEFKSPVRLQRVDAVPSVATARNSYTKVSVIHQFSVIHVVYLKYSQ